MVEFKKDEIAVIFEPIKEKGGTPIYKPCDVVTGTFSYDEDKFIDENLYEYSHIIDKTCGKGFAHRQDIVDAINKYPDKSLNEIKEIIYDEYCDYDYMVEERDDENYLKRYNEKLNKDEIVYDKDLIDRIYMLYDVCFDDIKTKLENDMESNEEESQEINKQDTETRKRNNVAITPKYLYNELTKTIVGQDDAIKEIVTTVWENYAGENKSNMIVLGPSGSGKTEIFRQLSKILDVPLLITSVTGMSQAGYVGRNTDDILKDLLTLTNKDVAKAEKAIVILDEFDKIGLKTGKEGFIATMSVQNELLKIVEDGTFGIELDHFNGKIMINTKNITFVGVGACSDILTKKVNKQLGFNNNIKDTEEKVDIINQIDIIEKLGFTPELIGRMGKIVKLNDLSIEDLKKIILNPNKSTYLNKIELLKKLNVKCIEETRDAIAEEIAKKAISKKIGARAIDSIINEMFSDIIFNINGAYENDIVEITKETVNNSKKYVLKK